MKRSDCIALYLLLAVFLCLVFSGDCRAQETLCNVTAEWEAPPNGLPPTGYVFEIYTNSDLEPAISDTLGAVTTYTRGYAPGDTLKCRVQAFIPLGMRQIKDPDTGEITWVAATKKWFGGWSMYSLLYVCAPGAPGISGPPIWNDRQATHITFINHGIVNGPGISVNEASE